MKQTVTTAQIMELSHSGLVRLAKWQLSKGYGENENPTIGQMIEFLDEHENGLEISDYNEMTGEKTPYGVYLNKSELIYDPYIELCDALWEACKEILEKS